MLTLPLAQCIPNPDRIADRTAHTLKQPNAESTLDLGVASVEGGTLFFDRGDRRETPRLVVPSTMAIQTALKMFYLYAMQISTAKMRA